MPGRDGRALKQLGDFGGDVVGTHEGFADEEGVHAVFPHRFDVGFVADAAFGHDDAAVQTGQQAQGLVEADFKRAQVAVVDAAQGGGEAGAYFQFAVVVLL